MSTPAGIKTLWKNINWKNAEEKLAFFNHYFKNSRIAEDYCKEKIEALKRDLIGFIQDGKIKIGDKERPITMQDIINQIRK